ncbi:hypothetical protein QZN11_25790 [Streptomyces gramineus]
MQIRPELTSSLFPADLSPGSADVGLWLPPQQFDVGHGQSSTCPVLVVAAGFSGRLAARLLPSTDFSDVWIAHHARLEGPEDQALDRLRAWLRVPEDHTDRRGCLLAKATAELAWENEAIAARSLATYETLTNFCRRLVEQAQRVGHVDPTADAQALGGLILAAHRGLEALAKAGVDPKTRNRIADAAIDSIALPIPR